MSGKSDVGTPQGEEKGGGLNKIFRLLLFFVYIKVNHNIEEALQYIEVSLRNTAALYEMTGSEFCRLAKLSLACRKRQIHPFVLGLHPAAAVYDNRLSTKHQIYILFSLSGSKDQYLHSQNNIIFNNRGMSRAFSFNIVHTAKAIFLSV